jgi:hypothetical protein
MAEKQKPDPAIVKVAAKAMKHPETVTLKEITEMGARLLDDQKNDPEPHGRRPSPRGSYRLKIEHPSK